MNNIPRIVYGNDFNIKIYMNEMIGNDDVVPYDLTNCTDIQVQMFCSKHKTMFELPFTIDPEDSSIIIAQIDYRLTHPNTMYGFVVNGYDEEGQHFQWCQKPSEGIMIVEGSSGALIDESMDNTIDISARIGFNLNLSNFYDKEEVDDLLDLKADKTELDNYVTKANDISKYKVVIPWHYNDVMDKPYVNFTVQVFNTVTNELVWQPKQNTQWLRTLLTLEDNYNISIDVKAQNDAENVRIISYDAGVYRYRYENKFKNGVTFIIYKYIDGRIDEEHGGMIQNEYHIPYNIYSEVAYTNEYNDLSNKPFIPTNTSDLTNDSGFVTQQELETKQDVLVSGTNIKTINNQSILGEGNIEIQGGGGDQVQSDWEQTDDTQVDYIKNKPEFEEPKIEFVEEAPAVKEQDTIYVESPVYDIQETSIDIVDEAPSQVEDGKIVIVSNPIQLKTINNQEIVGEGNIEVGGGGEQVQSDWNQTDNTQVDYIKNKPDLSEYAQLSDLATVATSGSYNDLSNKPTIPTQGVNAIITISQHSRGKKIVIYIMNVLTQTKLYGGIDINNAWNSSLANYYNYFSDKKYYISYRTSDNASSVSDDGGWTSLYGSADFEVYQGELYYIGSNKRVEIKVVYNNNDPNAGNLIGYGIAYFPTIPGAQVQSDWNETNTSSKAYIKNKPDLSIYAQSSNLSTVATTGDYTDLSNTPDLTTKQDTLVSGTNIKTINNQSLLGSGNITIQGGGGTQIQSDWNQSDNTQVDFIKNKPDLSVYVQSSNLATVATSGSYNDLSNTPDLSIYAQSSNLATVATSGSYNDLSNKPTIPAAQVQSNWNETNTSSKAYIQNKPTIPTVPTNVSAFNNDAGYISSIPNTVVTSDTTGLMIKVVNTLPPSPDNNTIYIIQ